MGILALFSHLCKPNPKENLVVPVPIDHGWKTENVTVTRHKGRKRGYHLIFFFPNHPNQCDATEIDNFMIENKAFILQSGGFPGAEMVVKFYDVVDRETANAKLMEILLPLELIMRRLPNEKMLRRRNEEI